MAVMKDGNLSFGIRNSPKQVLVHLKVRKEAYCTSPPRGAFSHLCGMNEFIQASSLQNEKDLGRKVGEGSTSERDPCYEKNKLSSM
jgi:hypothetical protein